MEKVKFTGTIFTFNDGENVGGEGTLLFNGKTYKLEFSANPHESEFTVDGQVLGWNHPMNEALSDFFSESWPGSDDDRWVVDDEVEDYSGEEQDEEWAHKAQVVLEN